MSDPRTFSTPLLRFICPAQGCGYTEEIGVGTQCGLLIKGDVTVICPRCGNILHHGQALLMTPVHYEARE